jgi:hypothetical protein
MNLVLRKTEGSVTPLKTSLLRELKETKKYIEEENDCVLLLDVSGSMADYAGEKTKIQQLSEVVNSGDFKKLKKIIFSGFVREVQFVDLRTYGSTDLASGVRYLSVFPGLKKVILVSDGCPDDEYSALNEGRILASRGVKVDIIYLGPGGDQGEAFMKQLAALTGGQATTIKTSNLLIAEDIKREMKLLLA